MSGPRKPHDPSKKTQRPRKASSAGSKVSITEADRLVDLPTFSLVEEDAVVPRDLKRAHQKSKEDTKAKAIFRAKNEKVKGSPNFSRNWRSAGFSFNAIEEEPSTGAQAQEDTQEQSRKDRPKVPKPKISSDSIQESPEQEFEEKTSNNKFGKK